MFLIATLSHITHIWSTKKFKRINYPGFGPRESIQDHGLDTTVDVLEVSACAQTVAIASLPFSESTSLIYSFLSPF